MPSIDIFRDDPGEAFVRAERVFAEGDRGDVMFAVLEGEIEVRRGDAVLERVGPGGVFGEMALIDDAPRSATATALRDARLVAIDRERFLALVRDSPFFALEVMQVLAQRLRRMDAQLG